MRNIPTENERASALKPEIAPQVRPAMADPVLVPSKRGVRLAVMIAVVVAAGLGVIWWRTHASGPVSAFRGGGRHHGGGFGMNNGPLPVVVQPAVKANLNIYLDGLGTVTPLATVTVQTQISGLLMNVGFQEGQMVKQGDQLALIDPRPYQVVLEQAQGQYLQAQAQLQEAKTDLARYETLAKQDSIAQQQVEDQQALVSQDTGLVQTDQAAIDSAKLNLTYCHIIAPVGGRVGLRQIDPGNYVTPTNLSNGLVVLTQMQPISVIFTLPEDNVPEVAARLHSGATIPVQAYDRDNVKLLASGTLSTIDNQVDTTTGTFKLRATFPNDDESLFPNQFVNIRMLLDKTHGSTVIPASALERGEQGTFVYVVKPDNTVTAQTVNPGVTEGQQVAVTGLALGSRVVVDGADRLKEGSEVVPQGPEATGPQGSGGATPHRRHRSSDGANGGGEQSPRSGSGQN